MAQSDPIALFKSLPEDKQKEYWGKLSPQDQQKFFALAKKQSSPQSPSGASGSWTPTKPDYVGKAIGALPAAGATVGALAGQGIMSVPGAALGGAAGKAAEQLLNRATGRSSPATSGEAAKSIGIEGVEQAILEGVGGTLMGKAAKGLSASADRAMNRILGLRLSQIPKWERGNAEAVQEVGKVVNKEIKGAVSLDSLANKISKVKGSYNQALDNLVHINSPYSQTTALHQVIDNRALKVANELELKGNKPAADQVLRVADTLRSRHPAFAKPDNLLSLKRILLNEKEWESAGGAATKEFREELYHDMNDAIKSTLPKNAATQFGSTNRIINRLIIADKAVKAKRVSEALAPTEFKQIARKAAAPLAGASLGAGGGYAETHTVKGALVGAAAGGLAGKAAESTAARTAAVLARRAGSKAAAAAAKGLPTTVRAIEAIQSQNQ